MGILRLPGLQTLPPEPVDPNWDRFSAYARRVRTLRHTARNIPVSISPEVIAFLLSSTPADYRPLLPRLTKIGWMTVNNPDCLEHVIPFVSSSVKALDITIRGGETSNTALPNTLSALTAISGFHLSSFVLKCDIQTTGMEACVSSFLDAQNSLTHLHLPCVSAKRDGVIQQVAAMAQLRDLTISLNIASTEDVVEAMTALVDGCPLLKSLSLGLFQRDPAGHPVDQSYEIPFTAIKPLLRYPNLKTLEISWRNRFDIQEGDILEMGKAWRHLESLSINGFTQSSEGFPLSMFPVFAEALSPSLMHLELAVLFTDVALPPVNNRRFPSLRVLDLGLSIIHPEHVMGVARYLAQLCPSGISIEYFDLFGTPEQLSAMEEMKKMVKKIHDGELAAVDVITGA